MEILNRNIDKEHEHFFTAEPSVFALKHKLAQTMESIEEARESMVKSFTPLLEQTLALREVEDFVRCHVKKVRNAAKCKLCTAEKTLQSYEKLICSKKMKKKSDRNKKRARGPENSDDEDAEEEENRLDEEDDVDVEEVLH